MLSFLPFLVPFVAVLGFGWWMVRWQFRRADQLLESWAKTNGFQIVEKKLANVGDGPTGTRQSSKRVKYRVTVLDSQGQHQRGLVSVGSVLMGTLSDEVSVEWDK